MRHARTGHCRFTVLNLTSPIPWSITMRFLQADLELDDHRTSSEFPDLPHSPEHEPSALEPEPEKRIGVRRVDSIGGVASSTSGFVNPLENSANQLKSTVGLQNKPNKSLLTFIRLGITPFTNI